MSQIQPVPQWALPFIGDEEKLKELGFKFNPVWLGWFLDLVQGLDAAGGTTLTHNLLAGLQGGTVGTPGEFYHLTATEHSAIGGNKTANTVYAGPASGMAAAPTFRALTIADGATGISTYAAGDMIYASAINVLAKLADVATGNALLSGGVGVAPLYGKIGLTTHVSGILPVANGGLGIASGTSGGVPYYSATGTIASSGVLGSTQVVLGGGAGAAPNTNSSLTNDGTNTVATALQSITLNGSTAANGTITIQGTTNATRTTSYVNLQPNGGFVGIGTASPTNLLHIQKDQNADTAELLINGGIGTRSRGYMLIGEDASQKNMGFGYSNASYTPPVGVEMLAASTAWMYTNSGANGLTIISSKSTGYIRFATGGFATANESMRIVSNGNVGIGMTTAPALLTLKAGTASIAPFQFSMPGVVLTTPLAGTLETTADNLHFTITTGTARKGIMLDDGARLTLGFMPVATFNGRIKDGPAWDGTTLTSAVTGALNGTLGATTPNTIAGTTGAFNGKLSSTGGGDVWQWSGSTTGANFMHGANTGGDFYFGIERSTGGGIFTGSTAYATVFGTSANNTPVQIAVNNAIVASFASTGLAVTGTLSATGTVSTGDPGLGSGAWKLGQIEAGIGLALNTVSYVQAMIDGVAVKLAQVL